MTTAPEFTNSNPCADIEAKARIMQVDFRESGWRQFVVINHKLKARGLSVIKSNTLFKELAFYIAAREEKGHHFDTECQGLRYDDAPSC